MSSYENDDRKQAPGERGGEYTRVSAPEEMPPGEFQPSKPTRAAIYILAALAFFLLGVLIDRTVFDQGRSSSIIATDACLSGEAEGAQKIECVYNWLNDEYYYQSEIDPAATPWPDALVDSAISGMMQQVQDDYTVYLEPVENAPLAEAMSGEYEGIGIWVDYPDGRVRVIAPMPGSPAEAAGLLPNDVITAVDGVQLTEENDANVSMIRGPAGTTVTLTIERDGTEPFDITVERAKITTPSVVSSRVGDDGQYALIQITIFSDTTTDQLDAALEEALNDGVEGIVIDLRNNGGGWVDQAQKVLGRFLPVQAGPALYEDDDATTSEMDSEPIIGGGPLIEDLPVVVLVNGGTASASEIVAGALMDYDRATLVGDTTFGKGSVQRVHDFDDGSSLRITFAQWLTPNQHVIQEVGIEPDYAVVDVVETESDEQLDAAIALLDGEPVAVASASPVASPMASPVASPMP